MVGLELILSVICFNQTCPSNSIENFSVNYDVRGVAVNETEDESKEIVSQKNALNGSHLRVGTLEDFPLSFTQIVNGTRIGKGVSFELLEFIAEKLNFTYEILVPERNVLGSINDLNGSLLELMISNKTDLATAFIPMLEESKKYIEYSSTILDEGEWILVMRRPEESAIGSGLLAPFEFWVWILIFVSLLAVGPIIYFLIIIRNKLTGDKAQQPYSIGHCAWFVYGALMKQGSTLSPIADSTRLLFATWWIFITILTSFYTANLTAFLTLSKFTLPFNTEEDIIKKEKNFVTMRGRGIEYAIKNMNGSLSGLQKLVDKNLAIFTDITNNTELLTTYIEEKNYIFIRDRPAIEHILYEDYLHRRSANTKDERKHCPFAKARKPILKINRAFVYNLGSDLKLIFDHALLNLVEAGIVKHLLGKNLPNAEACPQDLKGTERQLRNGDLMMTYYITIAGFATATVVFVTEIVFRYLNEQDEKKETWNIPEKKISRQYFRKSPFINTVTPPPPYGSIFKTPAYRTMNVHLEKYKGDSHIVKRCINGRDYMIFKGSKGENKLVPIRAPSTMLFEYSYIE